MVVYLVWQPYDGPLDEDGDPLKCRAFGEILAEWEHQMFYGNYPFDCTDCAWIVPGPDADEE